MLLEEEEKLNQERMFRGERQMSCSVFVVGVIMVALETSFQVKKRKTEAKTNNARESLMLESNREEE
jgi:predicted membrane-bound mannosyltransferase